MHSKMFQVLFLTIQIINFGFAQTGFTSDTNNRLQKRAPVPASSHVIYFPDDNDHKNVRYIRNEPKDENCLECGGIENNEMSISFLNKLNEVDDYDDFVQQFINLSSIDKGVGVGSYVGGDGFNATSRFDAAVERSIGVKPKQANCIPEPTVVSLRPEEDRDPTVVYFPSCTRVKKCGGCCSHRLLKCKPTSTQSVTFELIKAQYTGGTKLEYNGKDIVIVDEHLKCKCDCAIEEKDCNPNFQKYDKSQCKCYCTNLEDQSNCLKESDIKIWDSNTCLCKCREESDCTSGSYFDGNTCKCLQKQSLQRNSQTVVDRRRLILKATPVEDSTNSSLK